MHAEATTMPGSNAQMHASAQETASRLANPDMSLGQLLGSFQAMNLAMSTTHDALVKMVQGTYDQAAHAGPSQHVAVEPPHAAVAADVVTYAIAAEALVHHPEHLAAARDDPSAPVGQHGLDVGRAQVQSEE